MRGLAQGQYVRAVRADGIGAGESFDDIVDDPLYRFGGIITGFNLARGTIIVVDPLENESQCWMVGAEHVDPMTLPDDIRDWAIGKQVELMNARTAGAAP